MENNKHKHDHNKNDHNNHDHNNHDHNKHDHNSHDHSSHHSHMIADFRRRFWVSLALTAPILLLSPMVQDLLGYELSFSFANYVLFALAAIIYFYGGWPFITGMKDELKSRNPGMMTLVYVAITVAFGYSAATTFGMEGKTFYWELATLIDIMLLGHWLEMRSVMGADQSLSRLVDLMPHTAVRMKDGEKEEVHIKDLKANDKVVVAPGEKIPADGTITEGSSHVNESMITGESEPVKKEEGDEVIAGTVNGKGSLTLEVKSAGENAYLNKVIDMVNEARDKKSRAQTLADRIASWLTLVALAAGFGSLAVWLLMGEPFAFALERMASVMVITCPHALGLAVPLVAAISTSVAAKNGLLIRNRTAFENARKISMVVFDKTGTLTTGDFSVTRYRALSDTYKEEEVLSLAASVEALSEHPLADGILKKMEEKELKTKKATNFESITGEGVVASVDGKEVKIVRPAYVEKEFERETGKDREAEYETVVYVIVDGKIAGFIVLADVIRSSSSGAVKALKKMGIKSILLTGDNDKVAKSVSNELNLDSYEAGLLPDQKHDRIKELKESGEFVAMTGDGVNDAPALAAADIGIAVGSGTDIAADTADIVLVQSDPEDIVNLIRFGRSTRKKIIQNFIWASGYNVVAIPLAAGVLYGYGILISPALGALLMSVSTIVVAVNAGLLKRIMKKNTK